MNKDYENAKNGFDNYVEECKNRIKDTFFKDEYLLSLKSLRDNLVNSGKVNKDISIEEAIKFERLQMIEVKVNHTMRVVEDVIRISEKLGTNIDFTNILKISALLHDIGRFDQATWNNNFSDSCYKSTKGINSHAHAGYHILFNNNRIESFRINKKFYPAVGSVIYNHGNAILTGDLALKLNSINELDVNKLTGYYNLNDSEKIIIAALVQMVRDVDMLDILYQNLTGELPVVRDIMTFNVSDNTIIDIAKYWEIDYEYLLEYNSIEINHTSKTRTINVPVDKINPKKLIVPKDIQERFFRNEFIDLKELNARKDWSFITGMWWRLNHFLNNISFTSNLELVQEKELLDKIYNKYPEEYKPLVKDAFEFASEYLLNKRIKENKNKIYTKSYK